MAAPVARSAGRGLLSLAALSLAACTVSTVPDGGAVNGMDAAPLVDAAGPSGDSGRDSGLPDAGLLPDLGVDNGRTDPCDLCDPGDRCCGEACVPALEPLQRYGVDDPRFSHCSGCGESCDADTADACVRGGAGTGVCVCGFSAAPCGSAEACVESPNARCADLNTDPEHCGAPNSACEDTETCRDGTCQCGSVTCSGSETCCAADACIDLATDPMNCGECGHECVVGEDCFAGVCVCGTGPACDRPDFSADLVGEICCDEQCIPSDDSNCGACGKECRAHFRCGTNTILEILCCGLSLVPDSDCLGED